MCESRCCWFLFFSSPFIVLEALTMMQWSNPIFWCVAIIMDCISMTVRHDDDADCMSRKVHWYYLLSPQKLSWVR
jgi:hypothetical protein